MNKSLFGDKLPCKTLLLFLCVCSVAKSCLTICDTKGLQHIRLPCPSLSPGVCSNSCPLTWWCYFILCCPLLLLPSFTASGSFPMSWLLASSSQSIQAAGSASDIPMNSQDWFPLVLIGMIFLQSKGLSRVFCNTIIPKHRFFSTQLSLWSNSHICTWLLGKP